MLMREGEIKKRQTRQRGRLQPPDPDKDRQA